MSGFPEDESAWLIEMDGPLYWSGRDGCRAWWSVADAVRFCRWDDADRLRRLMGFEKARVREHVWPRTVMPAVVRPVPSVEPEPPPAPAQAGWTDAQLDAAWDFHLRTRGYTIDIRASREMICGQLAEIAPLFAPKVRVKLPDVLAAYTEAYEAHVHRHDDSFESKVECARTTGLRAALRQAGVEIEGEQP